jgi:DNA-binding transcriptional LysR family regulator
MDKYCPFDSLLKQKLGAVIQSQIQSDNDQSRLDLVRSGIGLSFLELSAAKEQGGEINILSLLDFTMPLSFAVLSKRLNDPIIKALIQEIRILWKIAL